jgi:hypothetical protein
MFDRVLSHAHLMDQMMERVGAEAGKAVRIEHGEAWHEARTLCLCCPDARRCQDWLDATRALTQPPDFCRSAPLLRRCLRSGDAAIETAREHAPAGASEP